MSPTQVAAVEFNQLYNEDCVAGLQRLEAGSIDLAFADPPFNIGYEYDVYDDRRERDHYLDWTRRWGEAVTRALKPTGTFWLAIGDEYAAELKLLFQNDLGFTCRSWVIWYYTFGVHCKKKFSRSHAHLFYFVKDAKKHTFNNLAIRVPSARQLVYADIRADAKGRVPDDTWILRPQDLPEGFNPDEDTWYFPRVCGTFKERAGWHGCQMPEQLLGRIIRACSNPGEVVLDPFGGSGTTLVVAKKLGRRWLGFDLSANYAAQAQKRLNAAVEGQPLEGAEEPQVSAPPTPRRKNVAVEPQPAVAIVHQRRDPQDVDRGLVEAFFATRDGFSIDRVIADPELNERFVEMCRHLGLPGQAGHWNHRLMNLRKASHLKGLPGAKRTTFTGKAIDRYLFACEIATQHFFAQGRTLDQILCEPAYAAEFDRLVRTIVPGNPSSLTMRWIALYIRKRKKMFSEAGGRLAVPQRLPKKTERASALDFNKVPHAAGLYLLHGVDRKLYVGQTLDLRQRLELQLAPPSFDFWGTNEADLEVRYCALEDCGQLKANQSRMIAEWNPVGNYSELAARL